jgi:hypothetical protein
MVELPREEAMANGPRKRPERVRGIEEKLDGLAASVDARFAGVDARFDQVDAQFEQIYAAITEQRAYTEFAYERLDAKMDSGFSRLDQKMDAGFAQVGGQLARLDRKSDQIMDLIVPRTPPNGAQAE